MSKQKLYNCKKCEYITLRIDNYKRHLDSKLHKTNIGEIEKKQITFECDKCDYKSERKYNLERHILTEHTNKNIKCEYCETEHKGDDDYNEHRKKKLHYNNIIIKLMTHKGTINGIKKTILNDLNERYINYKKTKSDEMPNFPNNFNNELYYKLIHEKNIIDSEILNELIEELKEKYEKANKEKNNIKIELNIIKKLRDNKEIDKSETFLSIKRYKKRKNIFIESESEENSEEISEELKYAIKHNIIIKQSNEPKNEENKIEEFKKNHEYLMNRVKDTIDKLIYFEVNDLAHNINEDVFNIINDNGIKEKDKIDEIQYMIDQAIIRYLSDD